MKLVQSNEKLYLLPNDETEYSRGIPIYLIPDNVFSINIETVLHNAEQDLQRKAVSTKTLLNEAIIKQTIIAYFTQMLNEKYE